jgi:hypothetical protein
MQEANLHRASSPLVALAISKKSSSLFFFVGKRRSGWKKKNATSDRNVVRGSRLASGRRRLRRLIPLAFIARRRPFRKFWKNI